ncbi:MAG: hypothetical protein SGBAC_008699 [Bacillariaceae sp.]
MSPAVSPRGVREVFQINNDKRHRQTNNKINNIGATSIGNVDAQEDKISSLKQQIEEMKQRLHNVESAKQEDKTALYKRMIREKAALRIQLQATYAPLLVEDSKINEKRHEMNKIIQYLKEDNARLRDQIQYHQKMIRDMKINNLRLEKINRRVEATIANLRKYIQTAEETNERLVQSTNAYKTTLRTMKLDLHVRDAYYAYEKKIAYKYERCIGDLTKQVEKKHRCGHGKGLIKEIASLAQEGMDEASQSCLEDLKDVDANDKHLTRTQRKCLQTLKKKTQTK